MNPGSVSYPRGFPAATYGTLDISEDGSITPGIVEIHAGGLYRAARL
jgi:predicted phosphodiesterase